MCLIFCPPPDDNRRHGQRRTGSQGRDCKGPRAMDLICPHCAKRVTLPDDRAGKIANCPLCNGAFVAPSLVTAPRPAPAPAPAPLPVMASPPLAPPAPANDV